MSGTASVSTQFANAVTATGLQLDNNYGSLVSYANDPTNRNNYAADAWTTNTIVLTYSPPVLGYTAGLELTWKWTAPNSAGVVVNANGLGNISVVNPDGTSLQQGQGKAGSIGKAVYDGTRAIYISSSAQRQGEAKAWAFFNGIVGTQTITTNGFNVSTIVRTGTGTYVITFITPFLSTNYAVTGTAEVQGIVCPENGIPRSTSSVGVVVVASSSGVAQDRTTVSFICFGLQ